jgi:hypothetical protein
VFLPALGSNDFQSHSVASRKPLVIMIGYVAFQPADFQEFKKELVCGHAVPDQLCYPTALQAVYEKFRLDSRRLGFSLTDSATRSHMFRRPHAGNFNLLENKALVTKMHFVCPDSTGVSQNIS